MIMQNNKGFSFVELIVVITIIALLFTIGAVSFTEASKRTRDSRRKADMESIRSALELCRSYTGQYPANIYTGTPAGITCADGSVTLATTPRDPRTSVVYTYVRSTTTTYTLSSSSMESVTNPYALVNP
jgi:prepilin-type N-terminal cleavage/methylation domain-containing protein